MTSAGKQAKEKRLKTRERLWPGAGNEVFDPSDRERTKGYSQVPRTTPMVARLINEIGGPENAGPLYQVLWAQDWGQGLVEVRSFRGLLYEAGYNGKGSRVQRTWEERIGILENLGFIKTARRGLDEHAFILLIDPHIAVLKLASSSLKPEQKVIFERWFPEFRTICEQWGIDLDAYKKKLAESLPEAAS